MRLSKEHKELLATLRTNYKTGPKNTNHDHQELNIINPPLNCPKWACIILPCIKHVPSIKLFRQIIPREAEVRLGSRWVCYDASSLNKGDVVRLNQGDIVPADVRLLNLGLEFVYDGDGDGDGDGNEHDQKYQESNQETPPLELIVDTSQIDGAAKPQTISLNADGTVDAQELYAGSVVLQGGAIAVVAKVGREVLLSRLIKEGQWPPQLKKGWQAVPKEEDDDDQDGISLQRQQEVV